VCTENLIRIDLPTAAIAVSSTPEEMARHLEREIGVWREVIARAKVTVQ
jgi:hypothetical protein